jgi:PAS domain S-box-containing protein
VGTEGEIPCVLATIIGSSLNAIVTVDERGSILEFNPSAERALGWSRDDLIGRPITEILRSRTASESEREELHLFLSGEREAGAMRAQVDAKRSDGGTVPYEATITAFETEGRKRFIGHLRDLSCERHHDEELQESQRRLELAVEGAKLGTWTFDLETGTTWYSERSKRMYGLPPDAVMDAASIRACLHPDDWEEVARPYLHGFTEDKVEVEYRVICPDGSTRWIHSLGAANRDEQGIARSVSGIHLDITDRKRAEEERDEARRNLDLAVEGTNLGLWSVDTRTGAVWHSDASRRLWGMDPVMPIDTRVLKDYIHPDDWEAVREPYRLGFPQDMVSLEHRVVWPTGEVRWLHALGRAQRDSSGAVTIVTGIHLDITDRKLAEEEIARSRDALHQSEKLAALGSLLAGVSHELNNPLSAIVGQAEMLEEDAHGTPLEARAKKISAAADRCARIVQTFLAMARRREPQRAPIDPNGLVSAALQLTEYGLRTAGIVALAEQDPRTPAIEGDSDQLHQVLVNLIINAQQALETSDTPAKRIVIRTGLTEAGRVAIDVVDNGPGIPPDVAARIFEPFFTTKPLGSGTGVGLSFSHGIVEAHGGSLHLLPTDAGAAFRIELPAAEPVEAELLERPPEVAALAPQVQRRALVVDDEPDIAATIRELLEREGFAVTVAHDGACALVALDRQDFDVILSDLRMPGVSGPEMYARLGETRPHLLSRIAFVTGDTLGSSMDSFLRESGRPVLEKPFTRAGVRCLVAGLVEP